MRLTQQANYAVRTLMYCAARPPEEISKIPEIARTYGISETHLFKVLKILVDHGYVQTLRGRNGGIRLAYSADRILLGEVIRAAEENFNLAECFDASKQDCPLLNSCTFNRVLNEALVAFFSVLDQYTIADLAEDKDKLQALLNMGEITQALANTAASKSQ
ncbi:MAG: iron-responsive transcriptional regulator RirA [Stappiaceae bacterium]